MACSLPGRPGGIRHFPLAAQNEFTQQYGEVKRPSACIIGRAQPPAIVWCALWKQGPERDVGDWHFASFRGNAVSRSLSGRSRHDESRVASSSERRSRGLKSAVDAIHVRDHRGGGASAASLSLADRSKTGSHCVAGSIAFWVGERVGEQTATLRNPDK
jgi:hypothetical protein